MLRVKPVGQYNNNNNDKRHNPIGRPTIVRVMCAPAGRPIHAMYPLSGNVRRNAQRCTRRPVFHYYYGFIEVRVCREWYIADDLLLLLCKALKRTTIIVLYH